MARKVKMYTYVYTGTSFENYIANMQDAVNKSIAELEEDGNTIISVSTDTAKSDYRHGNHVGTSSILYESGEE